VTVVCGYVPTPQGRAALRAALDEADRRGESLHVVNTSRGDALVDPTFAGEGDLADIRAQLDESGVPFTLDQQVTGHDGADGVLAAAREHEASLVVIGLRRRSPTGKLLFGSTAQKVLLEADCMVLAVKASPNNGG